MEGEEGARRRTHARTHVRACVRACPRVCVRVRVRAYAVSARTYRRRRRRSAGPVPLRLGLLQRLPREDLMCDYSYRIVLHFRGPGLGCR